MRGPFSVPSVDGEAGFVLLLDSDSDASNHIQSNWFSSFQLLGPPEETLIQLKPPYDKCVGLSVHILDLKNNISLFIEMPAGISNGVLKNA